MKYGVLIFWSEEDQAFLAEVPELPGCMADGPTDKEAVEAVEQVAREWIETAKQAGRQFPATRG